ncbi:hypothetical protein PHISCL_07199 [Aspergillus sclerotialis]|uniref:Uncharacterized protein n=1 Tax=Aspergillus sclerotialis TaxID=2070753 RepID=A0A3A2ZDS5_9EURO|nr:hypothetical protein PHISCL_07199 [Aspergillus sclerotialis]
MEDSNSDEQISSTLALQLAADSLFNSLPDLVIADGIDFPRIAAEADETNTDIVLAESEVDIREPVGRTSTPPTRNRTPEPEPPRDPAIIVEANHNGEADISDTDSESDSSAASTGAGSSKRRRIPFAQFLTNLSAVSRYSRAKPYESLSEEQLEQEKKNKILEIRIHMYHRSLDLRSPLPTMPVKPPAGPMRELLLARLRMVPLFPDQYPSIEGLMYANKDGGCSKTVHDQVGNEAQEEG